MATRLAMRNYGVSLVVKAMFAYIKSFFFRSPVEPISKPLEPFEDFRETPLPAPCGISAADNKSLPDVEQETPPTDLRSSLQLSLAGLSREQIIKARAGLIYILLGRSIKIDESVTTAEILDVIPDKNLGAARLFLDDIARN